MSSIFVGNLLRDCNLEKIEELFNTYGKCSLEPNSV